MLQSNLGIILYLGELCMYTSDVSRYIYLIMKRLNKNLNEAFYRSYSFLDLSSCVNHIHCSPFQAGSIIVNLAVSYSEFEISDVQFHLAFYTLAKINPENAHSSLRVCTLVSCSHLSSRLELTHDLPRVESMKISGPLWHL